ncbi:MAG: hypothetical protein CL761_06155 [Chloroflexi bacterium]|nr:hypothetical protein [Chloroflexota bacterium]|tara:strand:+ start:5733 stop:6074 length:342 start_codon:yes stop_codon:yes gene_type:complete
MEPKSVNRLSDGLEIIWENEVSCVYPYKYLRLQCACANCVEELTGRKLINVSEIPDDIIIVEYLIVGKYALQFLWSDGHETGIYPYNSLLSYALNDEVVLCTDKNKLLTDLKI